MDLYLWVKSAHIFSVIAWMAVLLYLPRLYVYHADATEGGEASETFKVMERRLLKGIGNPAMVMTWAFGLWLAFVYIGFAGNGWLHAKLFLVVVMTGFHMMLARFRKAFAGDANMRPARFYRLINEVPAVLLIALMTVCA